MTDEVPRPPAVLPTHTTVFVVAADARRRSDFATVVRGAPDLDLVGESDGGEHVLAQIAEIVPDVVVLEATLGGPDGGDLCTLIADRLPVVRTIVVTASDDAAAYECMAAGAIGCLLEAGATGELLVSVRRVSWGEAVLTTGTAKRMLAEVDGLAEHPESSIVPAPRFTPTEREVLRRVASGSEPASVAALHEVPLRVVNLHAAFAVSKLHRLRRDTKQLEALR